MKPQSSGVVHWYRLQNWYRMQRGGVIFSAFFYTWYQVSWSCAIISYAEVSCRSAVRAPSPPPTPLQLRRPHLPHIDALYVRVVIALPWRGLLQSSLVFSGGVAGLLEDGSNEEGGAAVLGADSKVDLRKVRRRFLL